MTVRRYRWAAIAGTVLYLLIFLVAIRDITISPAGMRRFIDSPSIQVVQDWSARMFDQQAAFYFESIAVIHPVDRVEILVSPFNIVIGSALGALVGLNVAVAWYAVAHARACRVPGVGRARAFGGLLGALPAFFVGMACCAPALLVVVGAQFTVLLTAVRSWFVPVAVVALLAALLWNAHRATRWPLPNENA
jgi:hypothetical protein